MKILLAIDESPCSHAAIDSVISAFRPERSEVKVLHVDEWPKDLPTAFAFAQGPEGANAVLAAHEERRHLTDALVDETRRRLEAAHFTVATQIRSGDARQEILDSAAEWNPVSGVCDSVRGLRRRWRRDDITHRQHRARRGTNHALGNATE